MTTTNNEHQNATTDNNRKVYAAPEIVLELDLETRAGSPIDPCVTPVFPLPESELRKGCR